uniref:2-hydroxyhepta-2,4-diene-1,7-dioate isomerase / 5-carboxymethyl-2-oxo-hex-3- ene-1,7-dioate decarboxylase n=1 Tax=uncultured Nocardioidaceae bacterium TaxID=253824 RepID=A0A6J4LY40_9ACTN|nr:MAG: 2-hydroxyhepta-2,4-diene-1,7-dioate isomerase / 5-carboxymethyl-2-oxo-hex-3- ene-1,7-dioate decarboxylase [uncultured Nocardioidaceae bacterium]
MHLLRLGPPGDERPAVRVGADSYVDVSDEVDDFGEAFFAAGELDRLGEVVARRTADDATLPIEGRRIGAPITRPQQIIGIGLNYRDHAIEAGMAVPDEPIVFSKAPNSLSGPNDDVHVPRGSTKTDWEVELGVVIGSRCRYLDDEQSAARAIAGYVVVNDVSERSFQLERGGQWGKGKSAETFTPCGPTLVTPDELPDLADLGMWLNVNNVRRQTGSTATMLFGPAFLVHYLSQFMVLEPGDLICTGTPPGVGMSLDPPAFLKTGDVVELGIDGLGSQRQRVVAAP